MKALSFMLTLFMILPLFLCACKVTYNDKDTTSDITEGVTDITSVTTAEPYTTTAASAATTSKNPENLNPVYISGAESVQDFIFRVNDSMPLYKCIAVISDDGYRTEKIIILDENEKNIIQTILIPDNELFTNSAAYFIDINFDGNIDILVPHYYGRNMWFFAYRWDDFEKQFISISEFDELSNPCFDYENKMILSHGSIWLGDGFNFTFYTMYSFVDGIIVETNHFEWGLADEGENLIHFKEIEGDRGSGNGIVKNEFFLPRGENNDFDENDPLIKPYLNQGTFWDLKNEKWKSPFLDEIK